MCPLSFAEVHRFVEQVAGEVLHRQQVQSLAHAVVGAMHAGVASIAAVGRAAARVREVSEKHSIKQVDRYVGNRKIDPLTVMEQLIPTLLGERREIVVAIDWTEFAPDEQATVAISMLTEHGRATPLLWQTVSKAKMKHRRASYEDRLLKRLRKTVPREVHVTVLADRAFGDTGLYSLLRTDLGFDFVIRFRGSIQIENGDGERRCARDWVPNNGQARRLDDALVTHEKRRVAGVVCVKRAGMKDSWCLATSRKDAPEFIVALYAGRFDIEHTFRDQKDWRFGAGLYYTSLGTPGRRDRMLLALAFAQFVATLLGAAGESLGLDRQLKANTSPKRTHSLVRQGREYLGGVARAVVADVRRTFHALWRALRKNTEVYALL